MPTRDRELPALGPVEDTGEIAQSAARQCRPVGPAWEIDSVENYHVAPRNVLLVRVTYLHVRKPLSAIFFRGFAICANSNLSPRRADKWREFRSILFPRQNRRDVCVARDIEIPTVNWATSVPRGFDLKPRFSNCAWNKNLMTDRFHQNDEIVDLILIDFVFLASLFLLNPLFFRF